MERYAADLDNAVRKVNALIAYYRQAASFLSSTEKVPAYILSRNKRESSAPVTYKIGKGYYDKTRQKLVVESWKEGEFTGKQHREARDRFTQLVKGKRGSVGFEISNMYYGHVKFEDHTLQA